MKGYSPFSRKGGKHMHGARGIFMKHFMRRRMDGHSSTSSSSSDDESHRNQQIESENERQHSMGHHDMKSKLKHDFGMEHHRGLMHGRRRSHGMMHKGHGHGMMHKGHGNGMMHKGHGHGMKHKEHGHGMMHRRHGMKHWHDKKHGKGHCHFMEHRMKHRHGMKHKMHHGHGRKHKMGHGPGMHHKLRHDFEKSEHQVEETRPLVVEIGNTSENSGSEAFTFYKPKTNVQIINENNKFQICLDTSHYQPEEVSVKIVEGKIDVSAMHESMEDNIYEFHEMYRTFDIPENINPEVIAARLNADGKLIIEAASNDQGDNTIEERDVPVDRVSE